MFRIATRLAFLTASVVALPSYAADDAQIARGEYLVTISGCNDCHTPGYFFGNPDTSKFLGGSDVGFEVPGAGVFARPQHNAGQGDRHRQLDPEQIVTAIQAGQRPDGRILAPIMPWHAFAHLTADDAMAIAAFLQSLKPVNNRVPGPFKPREGIDLHVPDYAAGRNRSRYRNRPDPPFSRRFTSDARSMRIKTPSLSADQAPSRRRSAPAGRPGEGGSVRPGHRGSGVPVPSHGRRTHHLPAPWRARPT